MNEYDNYFNLRTYGLFYGKSGHLSILTSLKHLIFEAFFRDLRFLKTVLNNGFDQNVAHNHSVSCIK